MEEPTAKQQKVLEYIRSSQQLKNHTPSLRETAKHFGVTLTAIADHVRALKKKGIIKWNPQEARSIRIVSPLDKFRSAIVQIPVYGAINAGFAQDRQQEAKACISVDVQ